jgi:hypothetical protein
VKKPSNLFYYDIRSSYPAAMLNLLPSGKPEISTEKDLNKIFGFVRAEISNIPDKLRAICPIHNEQGQMIFPNTPFTGVFFSEELKALVKLGANYEIYETIKFKPTKNYFNMFVEYFFYFKTHGKGIIGLISKLILNSLYGKFGMKDITSTTIICDENKLNDLERTHIVNKIHKLSPDKFLVIYQKAPPKAGVFRASRSKYQDKNYLELFGEIKINNLKTAKPLTFNSLPETNVAIAAAVTAYGRLALQNVINIPDINIIMMDTDSV